MKRAKKFGAICRVYNRVTDMRDGTYRPEVYGPGAKDIWFGGSLPTIAEANERARAEADQKHRAWLAEQTAALADQHLADYRQLVLLAVE